MNLHILGICGTFMGGVAALARELGHRVQGSDANVYPPMSTQLEQLGIELNPSRRDARLAHVGHIRQIEIIVEMLPVTGGAG